MSRLEIPTPSKSQLVVEGLYKELEHRIEASPPGLCPVDITRAFLELCHAQTCGKCAPCRIGLLQLKHLITDVLNGEATMDTLDLMEETALSIMHSADCAIGYEAAGNCVEQGGFARAVGAYYSDEIALFHIEGEVVEHQLLVWRARVEGL